MVLYRPCDDFRHADAVYNVAAEYECSERATMEVMQYARVLTIRGVPFSQMIAAVTKYAKIRGNSDKEWGYA